MHSAAPTHNARGHYLKRWPQLTRKSPSICLKVCSADFMLYFSLFPLIFLATTNMQVIGNTKYTVTADGNQHQELKDRRFCNVEVDPARKQ